MQKWVGLAGVYALCAACTSGTDSNTASGAQSSSGGQVNSAGAGGATGGAINAAGANSVAGGAAAGTGPVATMGAAGVATSLGDSGVTIPIDTDAGATPPGTPVFVAAGYGGRRMRSLDGFAWTDDVVIDLLPVRNVVRNH